MLIDHRSTLYDAGTLPSAPPLATNCESHRAETTATGKFPHGEIL